MTPRQAIVVATYSQRMRIGFADGTTAEARIKGKRIRPVCGDRVIAEPIDNEADWLITKIVNRDNELTRPDSRGRIEVLAANLDHLVVVAAAEPRADWFIVDRYLCAAELMSIPAAVVFNKIDISDLSADTEQELACYARIGYPVLRCSATTGTGLKDLGQLLNEGCCIFVGQSGVGKSSLINQLAEEPPQRVAGISGKTGEGRHTTVNSVMIPLPGGGSVIDSPGVRDYSPALQDAANAALGFREIAAAAQACRFANCRHLREPGCAVKEQVDAGLISTRRYASYKRIVNLTEQLGDGRY